MNKLCEQFSQFFDQQGWSYHLHAERPIIRIQFCGDNGRWSAVAIVKEGEESVGFISLFPSRVPEARRGVVAELLARLNYDLKHGCFELDFTDGEIRYRTSLLTLTKATSPEELEHLIFTNLCMVDCNYDTLMKVIHGGLSPQAALARKVKKPKAKSAKPKPRFELN